MVRCAGGGTVSVVAEGKPLREYEIKERWEDKVKTYSCIIEATEGNEYEVKLDNFAMVKQGKFKATVYVDGREADNYIECAYQSPAVRKHGMNRYTFKGFLMTGEDKIDVLKAFRFEPMNLTDEESAWKASSKRIDQMCTIRVEITQTFRKGGKRHDYFAECNEPRELPDNPMIHEDSAPAKVGIITGYGQEKIDAQSITCRCVEDDTIAPHRFVVIFYYMPHKWLVIKSLIYSNDYEEEDYDDDDEDDVEIDVERTEKSALALFQRREAEGALQLPQRQVRVKQTIPLISRDSSASDAKQEERQALSPVKKVVPTHPMKRRSAGKAKTILYVEIPVSKAAMKKKTAVKAKKISDRDSKRKKTLNVKQEIDMEGGIKAGEHVEVYDLTGDGEFVFPSRQIGETIILSDY